MSSLQPGQMRHRVSVLERAVFGAQSGDPAFTFSTVGTYWAQMRALEGREVEVSAQVVARVTHEFRMRWNTNLKPQNRLSLSSQSRNFEIVSVVRHGPSGTDDVTVLAEELVGELET